MGQGYFLFDLPFNLCYPHSAGSMDFMDLLEQIDLQIAKAKEEASSRKEILEKVEKWFTAREEESWLEEYNRVNDFVDSVECEQFCPYFYSNPFKYSWNFRMIIVIMLEEVHIFR